MAWAKRVTHCRRRNHGAAHLAQRDGVLRAETTKQHKNGNHDTAATGARGGRERRAQECDDKQQDVNGTKVLPKSFVGAKATLMTARACAAVIWIANFTLHIRGAGGTFSAQTNHGGGAAIAGGTRLIGQEHLKHLSRISGTLKACIAVAAYGMRSTQQKL